MRTYLTDADLRAVEGIVGHAFRDVALPRRALTHSSASADSNEALATLGDAIHTAWVARRAFSALPNATKGRLTGVIDGVRDGRKAQALLFRRLGLDGYVVLGGAAIGQGGIVTRDMAATAFEAIIAAIEIDGGRAAAEEFLDRVGSEQLGETLGRFT